MASLPIPALPVGRVGILSIGSPHPKIEGDPTCSGLAVLFNQASIRTIKSIPFEDLATPVGFSELVTKLIVSHPQTLSTLKVN
jgi:hypothetical protein